jgi:predicted 3-demethylubiquinone-9 3-methyltransferase (glyoxalase superfamily)
LWEKLSEGGEQGPCGWLTDKFGVSWQVIPRALGELLNDEDPERAKAVMNAMLKMSKIEIAGLREAYESVS